jgi:murein L,D-transpeptidase YcbB/YkuD
MSTPRILQALVYAILLYCSSHSMADVRDEILTISEGLQMAELPSDFSETIVATPILPLFYQTRNYQPAWENEEQAEIVLKLLEESHFEGLNPDDYHYRVLREMYDNRDPNDKYSDRKRARFDILLTDGLLVYYRHLVEGKVDAGKMESSWNYSRREFNPQTVSQELSQAIKARQIPEEVESVKPDLPFYRQMKASLALYRQIAKENPFAAIADDKTLRLNDDHPNVTGLRRRLEELQFLEESSASTRFDQTLHDAVIAYQADHNLDADGIVGPASWTQLNVPYARRIEQLRINLDRLRWIREDRSDDFIVVNIAGFELYHMVDDKLNWSTPVMVGNVRTQTPMFHSRMSYLVLNPTWTVPRSIIRRSLWAKFSADPSYVNSHNYHLYDSDGNLVDPLTLDWSQYSAGRFPFRVVQQPGPGNALGRVKFMFPNQHAIYLHDTPSQQLFSRTARAFSAGCIRVKDPLELARILLEPNGGWSMEAIDLKLEKGKLENIHLKQAVDVLLMYWTNGPTFDGEHVKFYPDIYDRDADVIKALNQSPVWTIR